MMGPDSTEPRQRNSPSSYLVSRTRRDRRSRRWSLSLCRLARAGQQRYWQVMPLCQLAMAIARMPRFQRSPEIPSLISLDILIGDGLLDPHAFRSTPFTEGVVNYAGVCAHKDRALRAAFQRFSDQVPPDLTAEFQKFKAEESWWLNSFCLFTALKLEQGSGVWSDWPDDLKHRHPAAIEAARERLNRGSSISRVLPVVVPSPVVCASRLRKRA